MNDSRPADPPAGRPGSSGDVPAHDLGAIWDALDTLPRASGSVDMAATTIDMAAVTLSRALPPTAARGWLLAGRRWLMPMIAVAGSLVAGIVAGRVTAPDPDVKILESLPLVRHLRVLREAGSVRFLQALAARRSQQLFRMPPEFLRDEDREFDAALADLRADHAWGSGAWPLLDDRRRAVAQLTDDDREALVRSAAEFQELKAGERRDLAAVAAALVDPQREELHAAARLWHRIVAASDPADRRNIIELDADGRIEWLERRSRAREWMSERRGLPPTVDGGPLPQRPPGQGAANGDGRPRRPLPRGEFSPRGEGPAPGPRGDGRGRVEPRPRGDGGPRGDRLVPRPSELPPEPPPPPAEEPAGTPGSPPDRIR